MTTVNEKIGQRAGAVRSMPLVLLLAVPVSGLQVDGFTSEAVKEAVLSASDGDTLLFPAGEYVFTGTVVIDRSLTLRGAADLVDVGVVEPGEPNEPPFWDGPPSVCLTEDPDLLMFRVESGGVTFERLKLVGAVTHEAGAGDGIVVLDHDRLEVRNCEITRFRKGVDLRNSRRCVVTESYLHENYRNGFGYGVSITGPVMATGGSEVSIHGNEFTFNRHSIASNSPETRFTVESNYFHDNDLVEWQACVDTHAQGGYSIRAVVRYNIFERTRPMGFKSGSLEITGNYFDPGCGDYSVGGYSRMLDFSIPTHNGEFIPQAILHDIYIADNVNDTDPWRRLLWVDDWDYEGETRFVAYNVFVDGRLFRHNSALSNAPWHPFPDSSASPFVGHVYLTLPDSEERVRRIEAGSWYDLHAFAVDAQGYEDIAEIGVQIASVRSLPTEAADRLLQQDFSAVQSYFIRGTGSSLHSRETEGSPDWSDVTGVEGSFVDGASSKWSGRGRHRVRLRARFRLSDQAVGGSWRIFGYARDQDGNLPVPPWHEQLEGWPIEVEGVEEGPATSVAGPAAGHGAAPGRAKLDGIYPNPFNPSATIRFTLSAPQQVTLSIHALNGQLAETLFSGPRGAGTHSVTWDAAGRASGVYLCRLEAEVGVSRVRKMVLVR